MRKLIVALLGMLFMLGAMAQEWPAYEIDPVATANASWKVGQRTINSADCDIIRGYSCYTLFLGISKAGRVLVQDWYETGEKHSDPYEINSQDAAEVVQTDRVYGLESVIGARHTYYINGQKKMTSFYENGKEVGDWTWWYDNGQKKQEGSYKNGQQHGVWREWNPHAQQMDEKSFHEGQRHGHWVWWYDNGQKDQEGDVLHGEQVGLWRGWYRSGDLKFETDHGYPTK